MNDADVRISALHAKVPVTLPSPKSRRSRPPEIGTVSIEIYAEHCRVWDTVANGDCGESYSYDPRHRALAGDRPLTRIALFPQVFRHITEQYAANRTNPLGAFLRNMVVAMERDLAEAEGACVYFAQADDRVKIGWSKRVASRIAELQTGNPSPLKLLGVVPGARAMERQMHERFAHLRLSGEWFRAAPELLAYIAQPTP